MSSGRAEIAGSATRRDPLEHYSGPADSNQVIEVTIVIRRPASVQGAASSGRTREEIEKSLSADPADIAAVGDFVRRSGLAVKEISPEKRTVRAEGPVETLNRAFDTNLSYFYRVDDPHRTKYLSYEGVLSAESDVAARIISVLGLDQKSIAKPRAS
jgi:hypothetical protein